MPGEISRQFEGPPSAAPFVPTWMQAGVPDRKTIQDVFIRVCRDSGFKLGAVEAATFAADLLKISPVEVWIAMNNLSLMEKIAAGDHPCCHR